MGYSHADVHKPLIAAIEGYCLAGGFELALFCDIRIAADTSVFGMFQRRFGVPLTDGGTQRLPRIVGLGRALELIHTGRKVDVDEALDWGLVNRVTEEGAALSTAVEMATAIASFPQRTVRTDRRAVFEGLGEPLESGLAIESWWGTHSMQTGRDGAERFVNGEGRHGAGTFGEITGETEQP
jgi:enoyl-CoA hydratase